MEKLKDPAMLLSIANSIALVGTTAYFYKQIEAIRTDMVKMSQSLTGVVRKITEMEKGEQNKSEVLHALNDQIRHINEEINALPLPGTIDDMNIDLAEVLAVLEEHDIIVERPSQVSYGRRSGDRRPTPTRKELDNAPHRDRRLYRSTAPTSTALVKEPQPQPRNNNQNPWSETDTDRSTVPKLESSSRSDVAYDTDPRSRQHSIREQPMREQPIREQQMREQPIREQPIREQPIREQPMREPRTHNDGYQPSRRDMRQDPNSGYDDDSDLIGEVRRQQDKT